MDDNYIQRCGKFIEKSIDRFGLDLNKLVVYTELGSKNYAFTPIIAEMANAKKVYAITKTSRYGTSEDNIREFRRIVDGLGIDMSKIKIVRKKRKADVSEADIVTNSGFVRPIDRSTIQMMKTTAVIPLMWETWEVRPDEIDLPFCEEHGNLVLGTNEEQPPMDIMRYSGFLLSKLLFENNMGVHKDTILVVGSGRLGNNLARFLRVNNIKFWWINLNNDALDGNKPFLVSLEKAKKLLPKIDAIVVGEHYHNKTIIGEGGLFEPKELARKQPLIQIIHICGAIEVKQITQMGLHVHPQPVMPFGHMTVTADYLGPKATLELNTAGLKVGEIMARNRLKLGLDKARQESLKNPLVMGLMPRRMNE